MTATRVPPEALRRVCDPAALGFATTADLAPRPFAAVQPRASEALAFGVALRRPGYNIFAVGAVAPQADLFEVADLLDRRKVKRVFVVEGGAVVGVVTRSDFVRAAARAVPARAGAAPRGDAELRGEIERRMSDEPWAPRALVTIVVDRGRVSLLGMVASETERAALGLLAREVPGVVDVADHLVVRDIPIVAGIL